MEFVVSPSIEFDRMMLFCSRIQSLSASCREVVIESGAWPEIMLLFIQISMRLFAPGDPLALSNANFFETTFAEICKTPEILDNLWETCAEIADSPEALFVTVCSLGATFPNLPAFYLDKIDDISRLLCAAISSGSRLLCDAAARTANIFIEYYGPELDPTALINVVFEACIECVTDDLLRVFAALLETTRDSEDVFDVAFPFLREVIINGCLELQTAALSALGALSIGSTVKIILNFDELYQLLMGLIQNPTADPIRGLLVECLTRSSTVVGDLFEPHVPELCAFCLENIGADDIPFAVSCLSSLEQICQRWPARRDGHTGDMRPCVDRRFAGLQKQHRLGNPRRGFRRIRRCG
jgi:hypothetical protein